MAISPKDPDEKVIVTFDFSSITGTISSPVVTVRQQGYQSDLANMVSGVATLAGGNKVTQLIQGGEHGKFYDVRCAVNIVETGEKYVAKDILTVKY